MFITSSLKKKVRHVHFINKHFVLLLVAIGVLVACGGNENKDVVVSPSQNFAPVAFAGDDQNVTENSKVILSGIGTDSDGTIIKYTWQQIDGISVSIEDSDKANAYFIAPSTLEVITLTMQLTVTDNQSASHNSAVKIHVTPFSSTSWEPSPISNCNINENISPVAVNVPQTLTEVGHQMHEPSIIFSDQTFTFYSREDSEQPFISKRYLIEGGYFEAVDGEDKSLIFDDGTHGDLVAGDGIYTRACLYLPEQLMADRNYYGQSNLFIVNKKYRGSESADTISPNVRVNETGFFISINEEYSLRYKNPWALHSPETCKACQIAWQYAGDVFDFFSVTPRDPVHGAGYVRVHDNIKGTGFTPPCEFNSYCYNIIDGKEHQELIGIIWNGWPGLDALNHELGHGLIGVASSNFPEEGVGAWNSGDGMHHDADSTVNGELSGPFWDPDRGWPHSVVLENQQSERFETYLIKDTDGLFKIKPLDDAFSVWDDILLYIMGLLDESEVTKTYYKLVNPSLTDCISEEYHLVCTNNLVDAEQVIPFTVSDFITKFGQWSAPTFYQPQNLTMGVLNISDRPHTNAEIVWMTKLHREFAASSDAQENWFRGTSWHKATRGLSRINIGAQALVNQNKVN